MKSNNQEYYYGHGSHSIVVNEEIGVQKSYSNIFYTKNQVLGKTKAAWEKIEVLNKEIEKTINSSLKSTLIRVKNDLCIEFSQYCTDRQNDIMGELAYTGYHKAHALVLSFQDWAQWTPSYIDQLKTINKKLWEELTQNFNEYDIERIKFWNTLHQEELKDKTDRELIKQYYGHFKNQDTHEIENEMLVKIKDIYTDLKETINKKLFDQNINEECIDQTWISVDGKYEQHLKNCENQYKKIYDLQVKIVNNKDFNDAQSLELELNQQYTIGLEYLKFTTNQIINRFISEGVRISGQPPLEEVETKSVIDNLKDELKEKIDQKFVEQGIEEQFKAITLQLCKEQYEDHLKKGDNIDKTIKQLEQGLALCDNLLFNEYQSFYYSLKHQQKAIDDWKNESVNLINDISKQASIFVHDQNANDLQDEMNQKIEHLEVENKNLSEKLDILFSANQEQKDMIKDHKETIKDLRLDKEDYKEKIIYLSKDKEELKEKVCKLEEKIDTKDKSLNLFEKILETFQLSSDDIEKQKQKFEKAKNDEKLKGELKSDIRMIKIGVKENLDDEKIKPFIKKITNEELFQEIKDKILSNPINLDDSGYESEVAVGIMGDDFE
jgi:hypothetical protein